MTRENTVNVPVDDALFWFLKILDATGGDVPAGDGYSVVAAFCDDRGDGDDTYNLSEDAGWSRTTHSGWGDGNATVTITDAGRAVLWDAKAKRPSAAPLHEGEGEPVAWRWQWPGQNTWGHADYNLHPDAETVEPLYTGPSSVEVERLREALEPFAAIAGRYLTGGLKSDLEQRSPDLITRLKAEDFYLARAALSRKQEPGVPTPGAWIEWSGGENPVGDAVVETRHANGDECLGKGAWKASWWTPSFWDHSDNDECRIIAYRIVPTPGGEGK